MKQHTDFISNSSSTSFVFMGKLLSKEEEKKIFDYLKGKDNFLDFLKKKYKIKKISEEDEEEKRFLIVEYLRECSIGAYQVELAIDSCGDPIEDRIGIGFEIHVNNTEIFKFKLDVILKNKYWDRFVWYMKRIEYPFDFTTPKQDKLIFGHYNS